MKKILLGFVGFVTFSNVYAINPAMDGSNALINGTSNSRAVKIYNPNIVNQDNMNSIVPVEKAEDTGLKPIYKSDLNTVSVKNTQTIIPAEISETTPEYLFKDCILKSDQMLEVLDKLKSIPEKERISTLYDSGYWSSLDTAGKEKTLKTLASLTGLKGEQYIIIKGKMAQSFQKECLSIIKK